MTEEPNQNPKDFTVLREYYSKIDFSFWDIELDACLGIKEGGSAEDVNANAIRIYSTYLQLIEVFYLNVFTITENQISNLFLNNSKLREKISGLGANPEYLAFFFEKWVFGLKEKTSIRNYHEKASLYLSVLKESTKDYLQDYDFLNAYKHGFRAHSGGPTSISISHDSNPDQRHLVTQHNSSVIFLSREQNTIFERSIAFDWQRVIQKCEFLLSMLQNTKQILQANGETIQLITLFLDEGNKHSEHAGVSRFKRPIYTMQRQQT
jgi:hypothetical protein